MPHTLSFKTTALTAALVVLTLVVTAAAGTNASAAAAADGWIVYVFDNAGNYQGRETVDHPLSDGSRWACRQGGTCNPCGVCHAPSQVRDSTYYTKYDDSRHKRVYYPRQAVSLSPGGSVRWGTMATLRQRASELVITLNTGGKDVMIFPAGSLAIRDPRGEARLVALPPRLSPRLP